MLTLIKSNNSDLEEYEKLEIENVTSIKESDLPPEFSDESFKVVDEFIRKTIDFDYEIVVYFDYITGKILKCKVGDDNSVKLEFNEKEFEGHHVASIHNHTKEMYTPPSEKNFGIFSRDWEEYELIAGNGVLWILKGKIKDMKLNLELKIISGLYFKIALNEAHLSNNNIRKIEDRCDKIYGELLSKYINDKNLNSIQLTKKEYNHD